MALKISLTARNSGVNAVTNLLDSGSKLNIYSNSTSQPASPETSAGSAVLLAQVPFSSTAFTTSTTGTGIAAGLPLSTTILNTGTAAWFRCINGATSGIVDGSITLAAASGDIVFDNVNFISGGTVNITGLSFTIPQ